MNVTDKAGDISQRCVNLNFTEILGQDELPPEQQVTDGIVGYPWSIENKYYTANVQLCSTPAKTIGDAEFAERLEAVIIVFDDKVFLLNTKLTLDHYSRSKRCFFFHFSLVTLMSI